MCELFAMSARHPSTVTLSLEEFSRRGGLSGPHEDGWGIVWYEDGDERLLKEALPAAANGTTAIRCSPTGTGVSIPMGGSGPRAPGAWNAIATRAVS